MKLAVFYENIKDGVMALGLDMKNVLSELKNEGMDLLYISGSSVKQEWDNLKPMLDELEIGIEGVYDFCDFTGNAPSYLPPAAPYTEVIDLGVLTGANNVLIVPGMVSADSSKHEAEKTAIVETLIKAVAYGKGKNMKVSMEDFDGLDAPYCTVAGLKEFMDRVPGLYCSFDTGNFVMYHEDELSAIELFADKLCTIHIKDRSNTPVYPGDHGKKCADLSLIYPSPVGYGTMKIKEILEYVLLHGYTGNGIVELYDCDPNYVLDGIKKSLRWLKQ